MERFKKYETGFGLRLKNWLLKGEREDDEMSRCYRRIVLTSQLKGSIKR